MGTPTPIPFWTQSHEARSSVVSAERLVNWQLERSPQTAQTKYPYALYPTPGLRKLTTVGDGPCRGLTRIQDVLWMVSGQRLYRVDSTYAAVEVGEIQGTGDVRMEAGEDAILVATDNKFYAADDSGVYELPHTGIVGLAYQDGYGIAAKGGWQQFFVSELTSVDPTLRTWDPADYSNADAMSDSLTGCASLHRLLWLFKQRTTEIWYNSGAAAFPFSRNQAGFLQVGCMAPRSIATADNTLFWLGHDHHVYMAAGLQPVQITTPALARVIEEQASPQSATAFVYAQEGHTVYCLSFEELTACYDLATGFWHYRESHGLGRWRANSYSYCWRKHVVGDAVDGRLYELDLDYYSEDGTEIRREAVSSPLSSSGGRLQMHELFVDIDAGVGLDGSVQGSDPELMVSWSDDGGRTFGNEVICKMGPIGEYGRQCRVNRLGTFRQRSIKIAVSDPVAATIVGAFARMEALES